MLINLSDILSTSSKVQHFTCDIELESVTMYGEKYNLVYKSPVELTISNVGKREVDIEGQFSVHYHIPCSRCAEDVLQEFDVKIDHHIDFKMTNEERQLELDEMSFIEESVLDIDKLVYDELLLVFPMKVLCGDDCKGICPVCGVNCNQHPCDCDTSVPDPRMAAIRDIFENFKEV